MTTLAIITKWPEATTADTDEVLLPLPDLEYTGGPRDSEIESKTSAQVIARRSRSTKVYPMATLTWIFTQVQYYAFLDFYEHGLGLGTAAFRINLRYPYNSDLTEWVVRFMGEGFSARQLDGAWQVGADVELLGAFIIDDPAPLEGTFP